MHNWWQQLGLDVCNDSGKISLIGSIYFVGWCIALPICISLADLIGRKKLICVGLFVQLMTHILLLVSPDYKLTIALMFMYGVCCPACYICIYTYTMEFIPNDRQTLVGTTFNVTDGLTYLIQTMMF